MVIHVISQSDSVFLKPRISCNMDQTWCVSQRTSHVRLILTRLCVDTQKPWDYWNRHRQRVLCELKSLVQHRKTETTSTDFISVSIHFYMLNEAEASCNWVWVITQWMSSTVWHVLSLRVVNVPMCVCIGERWGNAWWHPYQHPLWPSCSVDPITQDSPWPPAPTRFRPEWCKHKLTHLHRSICTHK